MSSKLNELKSLNLSDRDKIRNYCANFDPYSDFNFTSLFCWDTDNSTKIGFVNNNLVVKFKDYSTNKPVVSLLGKNEIDNTLRLILNEFQMLSLVPAIVINSLKKNDRIYLSEDRDSFDYIYDLNELVKLEGNAYKKKRHKINKISKNHGHKLNVKDFTNNLEENLKRDILKISVECNKYKSEHSREVRAIKKAIDYFDELSLILTCIYYDEQLVGFSINEKLDYGYAICHFEKMKKVVDDVNTFAVHKIAVSLLDKKCKLVNWEQDLGIDGLRKSKVSFQPKFFLKKFYVKSTSVT